MAQSAHSTGDEHLDSLIRMAPIAFEGGAYVLRALCMLTALLLSSSDLGLKCGLSTTLIQKFAEVKATRSSGGDLATVNLDEILQFYKDVIKTYQLHVGRIKSLVSFNNMAKYTNVTGVHGVNDNSFHRLHSVLLALSFNCIPLEWGVGAMFEPASAFGLESKYRTNEYSYLKLFRKEYASFVANLLGPKPTLGACLTLLTPRVLLDEAELISLRVFRRAVDGAICILSLGDSNYDSGVPVFQLLTFRDSLATRCASDYNSFDRMGFSEVHAPHLDYFRQAMESLASFEVDNYDHQEPIVVEQEYVELDCTVDNLDELDVVEGLRNSETKAYTDCVSSDVKTDIRMKALCNAMREYNVSVSKLRSDTVKVCADSDYRKRLKDDKDIWASQCSEIMRLNRDADLWLNTVFKLAKDFRVLKVCKRPEWLQKNVQDFAADCFGFPIK